MAFGGSGWAGGLREVRGFALAVDICCERCLIALSRRGTASRGSIR
jgi:hypothetical protein